jgi:hypothetical protein
MYSPVDGYRCVVQYCRRGALVQCTASEGRWLDSVRALAQCTITGLCKKQKDGALHYTIHTLTFIHLIIVLVYISLAQYPAQTQAHMICTPQFMLHHAHLLS